MNSIVSRVAPSSADVARLIEITDPDDPRIAFFRDIRERDLARRSGFVAEGTVVVESLLSSPFFEAASLLLLANRVEGVKPLIANVPPGTPVFVAERAVLDRIAGFPMHRGVLAAGVPRSGVVVPSLAERIGDAAERKAAVVVAVGIANHDNMGAIFRNACAFGADAVFLDPTSCDPLYRKAIRVSAGGVLHLPFERVECGPLLELLMAHGFRCLALSPGGALGLGALDARRPTALLLGTEGRGLPPELLRATETLRIDMAPGFDSLNVATAAAIALQRLYSARLGAA